MPCRNDRTDTTRSALLGPGDPGPVIEVPGRTRWLVTVEHAGHAVPRALGALGLSDRELRRHIGWDPGALDLAQAVAAELQATLIAQPYSRLVIDCNRPRHAPDLAARRSDGTEVPGNHVPDTAIEMRWQAIHQPYHAAIAAAIERGVSGLLSVHSYTARRRGDARPRPWPIGLLARCENPLVAALTRHLARLEIAQPLGVNAPYEIEDDGDYTIPVHAEPRGLPHVLIEARSDRLVTTGTCAALAAAIAAGCRAMEAP